MAIRPPLQKRSRATLERILTAVEELLMEHTFEELGIHELVRRAGTSVGAFYARFSSKEELLPALYERYDATMPTEAAELVAEHGFVATDRLVERARQVVRFSIGVFRARRGLLRALTLHARKNPEDIPPAARERRHRLHKTIAGMLLELEADIDHPYPRAAVDMGLLMVASTVRERILFSDAPHGSAVVTSDAMLEDEMTRALCCYLCGPPPA